MVTELRARAGSLIVGIAFAFVAALTFTLTALAAQSSPSITVTPAAIGPDETVTVTIANGPGSPTDWVALYPAGAPNPAYLDWKYLDGSRTVPSAGMTGATLTFTLPTIPGAYDLRFYADNGFTLLGSATATVVADDTTPPAVALTAPAAGVTVSGVTTVSATASDDVGVAGIQFQLDGAPLGAEDVTAPYSVSWTTTTATNGPHTLTAVARDAATNQTTSAARSITVDKTFPVISAVAVSSITATGATFTWTTDEPSDTQVNYGLTTAYGTNTPLIAADVTAHSVVRTGLTPNTTYHYRVRSRDAAVPGNLALSGDFTFTTLVDVTSPAVALTAPAANATVSGSITVTATASDSAGVAGVQFQLDGAPLGAEDVATPFTVLWDTTTASDGVHTLTAVARDAATNQTTSAARTVTVANDVTPPVVSAVGASSITAAGATIAWTTNEASDSQVEYGVTAAYGSASALNASLVTSHSMGLSGLAVNTTYHYRVRSEDAAGNLATSGDMTFTTVDGTAPTVVLTAPAANATVSGSVTVSATASDSAGVAGVQFRLDGAPLGAEDVTAPYALAWNTQGSPELIFGVVMQATESGPTGTVGAGTGFTERLALYLDETVTEDKVQVTAGAAAATFTLGTAGRYFAQMAAFKANGTPAYVQGAAVSDNATSPTIGSAFASSNSAGNLIVVVASWSGNSAVSATDSRGNVYAVATMTYDGVFDQSLAILYAANVGAGANTVTAAFGGATPYRRLEIHEYAGMATSNVLDVTATNIATGTTAANSTTSGSATTTMISQVSNGAHVLTAQARDAAGNITTSAAVTVTVNNGGDTTPPVISGVTVSAIASSGATIVWTTNEASDSQVEYGVTTAYGSASALNASLVTSHSLVLSGLAANTAYHYRVRSEDAAGNLATSGDVMFTTVDGTAPTVALTAPAASATVSGSITVSATASDNVGVAGVQFRLDGAPLGAEDVAAPFAVLWDTTTAGNGLHTLTAVARDAATNQTTSAARTVTVANDSTPPVVSAVAASAITAVGATIGWTTNEASDSQVEYGVTTAYGSASALNASLVTSHSLGLSGLAANTTYHYRVRSEDAAGNLATSGDMTFTTVDGTAPTVVLTAPAANATVSGSVTVSATASDSAGVAGVQFRLDGAPLGAEDVTAPYALAWNTQGSPELIFGVVMQATESGPTGTVGAGTGFTERLTLNNDETVTEDKVQVTAGAAAATFTLGTAGRYFAQMAAFKANGTPAYVQGAAVSDNATSPTIGSAFASSNSAGNLIVVVASWSGNGAVSATDSRGNVYAVATMTYDGVFDQSLAILYAANVAAGANTVTAAFGGTTPYRRLEIHEYAGMATSNVLDVTATNIATGTTAANSTTSGSVTTTLISPVSNGAHVLTAQARDAAGNITTSAAVTVTVNNAGDTTPPAISGVTVSALTSSGAAFSWTTNETSDTEVEYGPTTAYGGFSTLNVTRVTAHTMSLSGLAAGTLHHYRVRSRDAAGNLGLSGDLTFTTPEGTPPTVAITAPAQGAMVSGTVTVTANASDNVGVVGVQFRVDGAPLGAEDLVAPYTVSWNTATASAGSPVLTAVARDAAGNQRTSSSVTVTVATADVTLAWNPNSESDLDGYKLHFGTAAGNYSVHVDVGNITSYTVSGLQTGTPYYFAVTAYNVNGTESGASNEVSATR